MIIRLKFFFWRRTDILICQGLDEGSPETIVGQTKYHVLEKFCYFSVMLLFISGLPSSKS